MNTINLKDCVICGRYIASSTSKLSKIPKISQFVPVISVRNSFKTCQRECSKKNTDFNITNQNKGRYGNKGDLLKHKINIEINWRILQSRDKFIQFCEDNKIEYNGNK